MMRVFLEEQAIRVPAWVNDLESFRRWSDDDEFPESGRISFLLGEVWIDMSKEQLFFHNDVKSEINTVLRTFVRTNRLGRYFTDGAFLSSEIAGVSNQPDGVFVSKASLSEERVQAVEGRSEGHVELEGSPDMVLEVVSPSSVEKDTKVLRQAYADASIREYWLVDARRESLQFDLLRLNGTGYRSARKRQGWLHSDVFDHWFCLTEQVGSDGFPEFTLSMREDRPS